MNTAELVSIVVEKANVTKKVAAAVVKSITGAIHESLKKHGAIKISQTWDVQGFGYEGKEWRESSYPAQDENPCYEIAEIPCSQIAQRRCEGRRNEIRQEKRSNWTKDSTSYEQIGSHKSIEQRNGSPDSEGHRR